MWSPEKYAYLISRTILEHKIKDIRNKTQLYNHISKCLNLSPETIKSWARKTHGGPKDSDDIRKLEEILSAEDGAFELRYEKKIHITREKESENIMISDLTKYAIHKAYCTIQDYLHDPNIRKASCFYKLTYELGKIAILFPSEIYEDLYEYFFEQYMCDILFSSNIEDDDEEEEEEEYTNEENDDEENSWDGWATEYERLKTICSDNNPCILSPEDDYNIITASDIDLSLIITELSQELNSLVGRLINPRKKKQ